MTTRNSSNPSRADNGSRILLTGAAGRFGSVTFRELRDRHPRLVATDSRRGDGYASADLRSRRACKRLLQGVDVLVHLANNGNTLRTSDAKLYRDNRRVDEALIGEAVAAGVRKIIYASSIRAVSGMRRLGDASESCLAYLPMDGNLPANPCGRYGLAKVHSEQLLSRYAETHGISATAVRFPALLTRLTVGRLPGPESAFLDEGFTYLTLLDAADLLDHLIRADLPGFRIYLPASLRNTMGVTAETLAASYFPLVPWRKSTEGSGLVDISEITRDTGWKPAERTMEEPAPPSPSWAAHAIGKIRRSASKLRAVVRRIRSNGPW